MNISTPSDLASIEQMVAWLKLLIAKERNVDVRFVGADMPFEELGLDSMSSVTLSGEIDMALDLKLPPTLLWDYVNIAELAQYLILELSKQTS